MPRLLNNNISKLDHLITTGKSFGDHNGVRYKGESYGSKTIFLKSGLFDDSINVSIKKYFLKSVAIVNKSVTTGKSINDSR